MVDCSRPSPRTTIQSLVIQSLVFSIILCGGLPDSELSNDRGFPMNITKSSNESHLGHDNSRPLASNRSGSYVYLILTLACSVSCFGCSSRLQYEIEMEITDDGFKRAVTIAEGNTDFASEDKDPGNSERFQIAAKRLESIYGESTQYGKKWTFTKHFRDTTPQDLGGDGILQRSRSPLGVTYFYQESLSGGFQMRKEREESQEFLETFFNWVGGWLHEEIEENPQEEIRDALLSLSTHIDTTIRNDARDLLETWLVFRNSGQFASNLPNFAQHDIESIWLRFLVQFLVDRKYVELPEVPYLVVYRQHSENEQWLESMLLRRLSTLMEQPTDALVYEVIRKKIQSGSFFGYVGRTKEYAEAVLKTREADDSFKEPAEWLNEQFFAITLGPFLANTDRLNLAFRTHKEPYDTNGDWDHETQTVRWIERSLDSDQSDPRYLPRILWASWSVPDEEFQEKLFGRVKFDNSTLLLLNQELDLLDSDKRKLMEDCLLTCCLLPVDDRREFLRNFKETNGTILLTLSQLQSVLKMIKTRK